MGSACISRADCARGRTELPCATWGISDTELLPSADWVGTETHDPMILLVLVLGEGIVTLDSRRLMKLLGLSCATKLRIFFGTREPGLNLVRDSQVGVIDDFHAGFQHCNSLSGCQQSYMPCAECVGHCTAGR